MSRILIPGMIDCRSLCGPTERLRPSGSPIIIIGNRTAQCADGVLRMNEPPADSRCDDLSVDEESTICNVQENGECGVTCDTDLFLSGWSRTFAHGSDMAIAPLALIKRLLTDGETVAEIQHIAWRKPATHNMRLFASVKPHCRRRESCFDGEVTTNKGRTISFYGVPDGESPIEKHTICNPYARDSICESQDRCSAGDDTVDFSISLDPLLPYNGLNKSDPMKVATTIEILTYAIAHAVEIRARQAGDTKRVSGVMGCVRNLRVPQDMRELVDNTGNQRLKIRVNDNGKSTEKSGLTLREFGFKFPNQEDFSTGLIAM